MNLETLLVYVQNNREKFLFPNPTLILCKSVLDVGFGVSISPSSMVMYNCNSDLVKLYNVWLQVLGKEFGLTTRPWNSQRCNVSELKVVGKKGIYYLIHNGDVITQTYNKEDKNLSVIFDESSAEWYYHKELEFKEFPSILSKGRWTV